MHKESLAARAPPFEAQTSMEELSLQCFPESSSQLARGYPSIPNHTLSAPMLGLHSRAFSSRLGACGTSIDHLFCSTNFISVALQLMSDQILAVMLYHSLL